jgi:hypothetical protein
LVENTYACNISFHSNNPLSPNSVVLISINPSVLNNSKYFYISEVFVKPLVNEELIVVIVVITSS